MPNQDDDKLNFDELNLPDDEAVAEEPILEDAQPIEDAEEATLEAVEEPEAEPVEELEELVADEAEEDEKELEKKSGGAVFLAEWAVAVGAPIVLIALFIVQMIYLSTAIYAFGLAFVGFAMWKGRKSNTINTIFLGLTLSALMTGAFVYWIQLRNYEFDIKAQEAKQQVNIMRPGEFESLV